MWTPATRRQHSRDGLRYETDLTDAEWAVIEPSRELAQRGRPRAWPLRETVNAIFYVLRGGIAWRLIPKDLTHRTPAIQPSSVTLDELPGARAIRSGMPNAASPPLVARPATVLNASRSCSPTHPVNGFGQIAGYTSATT